MHTEQPCVWNNYTSKVVLPCNRLGKSGNWNQCRSRPPRWLAVFRIAWTRTDTRTTPSSSRTSCCCTAWINDKGNTERHVCRVCTSLRHPVGTKADKTLWRLKYKMASEKPFGACGCQSSLGSPAVKRWLRGQVKTPSTMSQMLVTFQKKTLQHVNYDSNVTFHHLCLVTLWENFRLFSCMFCTAAIDTAFNIMLSIIQYYRHSYNRKLFEKRQIYRCTVLYGHWRAKELR